MPASLPPTLPLRADVLLSNALFGELVEDGITEEFLQRHTGQEDLAEVESLELRVDAVSGLQSVECLGQLLPNLVQLKLSQSNVSTLRDLGTGLSSLRVLYLSRSSLQDLCGITALPCLQELYVAFNDITDLSSLWTHEALQVLDLEGNLIEDFEEVKNLEAVATLRELNLGCNPIWRRESLTRERVLQALPQLEVLDDVPASSAANQEDLDVLSVGDEELNLEEELRHLDELEPHPHADILILDDSAPPDAPRPLGAELPEWHEEPSALSALRRRAGNPPRPEGAAAPPAAKPALPQATPQQAPEASEGLPPKPSKPEGRRSGRPTPSCIKQEAKGGARATWRRPSTSLGAAAEPEPRPEGEPTEQDLVVESLKKAPRPAPSLWSGRHNTARGDFAHARPGCFLPDSRVDTSRWYGRSGSGTGTRSISGASSTTCGASHRPATASSATSRASRPMSEGAESSSSNLTAGDDGAALVGNPLAAIRRRRRDPTESEVDIRGLLRRFEAAASSPSPAPEKRPLEGPGGGLPSGGLLRPCTPDVRIRSLATAAVAHSP